MSKHVNPHILGGSLENLPQKLSKLPIAGRCAASTQSTKVEVTAETKAGVEEATRRRRYDMTEVGAEYEYIYAYGLTWIGIPMK